MTKIILANFFQTRFVRRFNLRNGVINQFWQTHNRIIRQSFQINQTHGCLKTFFQNLFFFGNDFALLANGNQGFVNIANLLNFFFININRKVLPLCVII